MEAKLTERLTGSGSVDMEIFVDGEVLLDRHVRLIDEVVEFIEQRGWPSLASILDGLREGVAVQPGLTERQRNAAEQNAIRREILNYRVQYEEPAEAAVRQLKIETPTSHALTKVCNGLTDGAFLLALDLDLSGRVDWPNVSSLAIRVMPELSANKFACSAFIARADHNIMVFYVGPYRPCLHGSGFYLIFDAEGMRTLAAAPQLPKSISLFSHCCIGSGAAVRRISLTLGHGYIVAELLLRLDSKGLPTSNATLCTWSNLPSTLSNRPSGVPSILSNLPRSFPTRWVETEVVLPQLPYSLVNGYTFHADTAFSVGRTGLCWSDLTVGMIVCKDMLAHVLKFMFVPLPEGLSSDPLHGRGCPEERRCMSCSTDDNNVIRFVCLENVTLTRWTFDLTDEKSGWRKVMSFDIPSPVSGSWRELWVSRPLLSVVDDRVIYVDVNSEKALEFRMAFYNDRTLKVVQQPERVADKVVTSSSYF